MKKIKLLTLTAAAALMAAGGATAQNTEPRKPFIMGNIPMFGSFHIERAYNLSDYRLNLGTARSAAMGGAFTSLGADLSSMHINPAGLGMYRSSELGFTFGPSFTDMTTSMPGQSNVKDSRSRVGLNNVGLAFNIFEGTGAVTSFTFGIGYNRLADLNYRYSSNIDGGTWSILDMFAPQVTRFVQRNNEEALNNPWRRNVYIDEYGAILAQQAGLISYNGNSSIVGLADGTDIFKKYSVTSKGGIGEYAFSGGWNFRNKLYFGLTFALIDIYQVQEMTYSEAYENNIGDIEGEILRNMSLYQRFKTVGDGYNVKLGFIYRPIPELRVGVAFHSPNITTVKSYFSGAMNAQLASGNKAARSGDASFSDWFYTPSRLLAGVSYTIADKAIFALDYEHAWYNGIRLRTDEYAQDDKDWFKDEIKFYYRGSHTVRFGTEIRPIAPLALRAGYVFTLGGQMKELREGQELLSLPVATQSHTGSIGLGYRITPAFSVDLTYMFSATKYTDFDLFYYENTLPSTTEVIYPGGVASNDKAYSSSLKRQRHNLLLSMSFRF